MSPEKIKSEIIKLPAMSDGQPDWDYMEQYMREVMADCERKYQILVDIAKKKHRIDTADWGEFRVGDLFEIELSSDDLQPKSLPAGNMSLVSSGMSNNGVCAMVDKNIGAHVFRGKSITVDMFGKAFYHDRDYFAVSHGRVNMLIPKAVLNEYTGLFVSSAIDAAICDKYSYSLMCTSKKIADEVVKLPVTNQGEPDWAYMESYMQAVMNRQQNVVYNLKRITERAG